MIVSYQISAAVFFVLRQQIKNKNTQKIFIKEFNKIRGKAD